MSAKQRKRCFVFVWNNFSFKDKLNGFVLLILRLISKQCQNELIKDENCLICRNFDYVAVGVQESAV